ncbi:MAG: hypothetical protein P4M08_14825, partial [Oligoflexia bacterium]|nr:hypothetical protein [Oligoflexia bacterium]
CNGNPAPYFKSCLVNTHVDAQKIDKELMDGSGPDAKLAPILASQSQSSDQATVMLDNAYLSAAKYLVSKNILDAFTTLKAQVPDAGRANQMLTDAVSALTKQPDLATQIASCEKARSPQSCGQQTAAAIDKKIQGFFTNDCPAYFNAGSDYKSACSAAEKEVQAAIDQNLKGGCTTTSKTGDSTIAHTYNATLDVGGYNFNCFENAIIGTQNCASLDCTQASVAKSVLGGKFVDLSNKELWKIGNSDQSTQKAKDAASTGTDRVDLTKTNGVSIMNYTDAASAASWVASQDSWAAKAISSVKSAVTHYASNIVLPERSAIAATSPNDTGSSSALAASNQASSLGNGQSAVMNRAPASLNSAPSQTSGAGSAGDSSVSVAAAPASIKFGTGAVPRNGDASLNSGDGTTGGASLAGDGRTVARKGAQAKAADSSSAAGSSESGGSSAGSVATAAQLVSANVGGSSSISSSPAVSPEVAKTADVLLRQLSDPASYEQVLVNPPRHVLIIDCGKQTGSKNDPWVILRRARKTDAFEKLVLTSQGWVKK